MFIQPVLTAARVVQQQHGVPVELYGKGVAKSVQQLWKEVQEGEAVLVVDDTGALARELFIVTVRVKDSSDRVRPPSPPAVHLIPVESILLLLRRQSHAFTAASTTEHICVGTETRVELQTLVEVAQSFDDGRRRVRNLPLSEKLKPGEDPCVAAERGIRAELGNHIGPSTEITVHIDPEHPHCEHSHSVSKSYPGLLSNVRSHSACRLPGAVAPTFDGVELATAICTVHQRIKEKTSLAAFNHL